MQEITQNVANVFSFCAIISIEHAFSMHDHSPSPLGGVKNRGLRPRFTTPPRDLANVNAWKTMFDPYIVTSFCICLWSYLIYLDIGRKNWNSGFCTCNIYCPCPFLFSITKTCPYNFDSLKPHFYIVKLGFTGVYIIFLISAQNIDCGYSLEPPRRGGSNEYPQSMFWAEIWTIYKKIIWKFSFFGGKIFNIFE